MVGLQRQRRGLQGRRAGVVRAGTTFPAQAAHVTEGRPDCSAWTDLSPGCPCFLQRSGWSAFLHRRSQGGFPLLFLPGCWKPLESRGDGSLVFPAGEVGEGRRLPSPLRACATGCRDSGRGPRAGPGPLGPLGPRGPQPRLACPPPLLCFSVSACPLTVTLP